MKSILRFLAFVFAAAAVVGVVILWRVLGGGSDQRTAAVAPPPRVAAAESVNVVTRLPSLAAIDREFTTLVGAVLPSVVSISAFPEDAVNPRVRMLKMFLGGGAQPPQLGSGVVVSDGGHVITNFHVVSGAAKVDVHLNDGRVVPAKFVGADVPSDVAILQVDAEGLQPLEFGDSDDVAVGQMVVAIGNPLGLQETVTQGIVSAKGRRGMSEAANELIQTDAAINPGNSGGPLVNLQGEIVGINNSIIAQAEGIGFAIPSNVVKRVYESIRDHGRFVRPWFGVESKPLSSRMAAQLGVKDARGALVVMALDGSPAERAGVLPGDVIVEFNGRPIRDHVDLRNRVAETEIGEPIAVRLLRSGREMALNVKVGPEPGV
jgi:serine protease Do